METVVPSVAGIQGNIPQEYNHFFFIGLESVFFLLGEGEGSGEGWVCSPQFLEL